MKINAVILAIDTHNHAAAVLEPEQAHTDECPHSDPELGDVRAKRGNCRTWQPRYGRGLRPRQHRSSHDR